MSEVRGEYVVGHEDGYEVVGPEVPAGAGESDGARSRVGRLNCVTISGSVRITTETEGPLEVGDANCVEISGDIEIKAVIRRRGRTGPIEDPAGDP